MSASGSDVESEAGGLTREDVLAQYSRSSVVKMKISELRPIAKALGVPDFATSTRVVLLDKVKLLIPVRPPGRPGTDKRPRPVPTNVANPHVAMTVRASAGAGLDAGAALTVDCDSGSESDGLTRNDVLVHYSRSSVTKMKVNELRPIAKALGVPAFATATRLVLLDKVKDLIPSKRVGGKALAMVPEVQPLAPTNVPNTNGAIIAREQARVELNARAAMTVDVLHAFRCFKPSKHQWATPYTNLLSEVHVLVHYAVARSVELGNEAGEGEPSGTADFPPGRDFNAQVATATNFIEFVFAHTKERERWNPRYDNVLREARILATNGQVSQRFQLSNATRGVAVHMAVRACTTISEASDVTSDIKEHTLGVEPAAQRRRLAPSRHESPVVGGSPGRRARDSFANNVQEPNRAHATCNCTHSGSAQRWSANDLTGDFVKEIKKGVVVPEPVLEILNVVSRRLGRVGEKEGRNVDVATVVLLVDGEGDMIRADFDIPLGYAACANVFRRGQIVRLTDYAPHCRNFDGNHNYWLLTVTNVALLGEDREWLDRRADDLSLRAAHVDEVVELERNPEVLLAEKLQAIYEQPLPANAYPFKCSGETCSRQGLVFPRCVALLHPPKDVAMPGLALLYPGHVSKNQEAPHIRNMLYWYYATSYFRVRGRGNRAELPRCLVASIRHAYPSKKGTKYVGFSDPNEGADDEEDMYLHYAMI